MAPMSNNQWTGAQDWNAQPQQSNAQDWNAQSAQDWNAPAQQPAQDWNAPAQQPTQDWGASSQDQTTIQPAAQDWNAPAQEQTSVTAAQDWNAQPQQQWNDQQQAVPYGGPQQWGGQQQAPSGLAALFDFGFKGSVLKNGIGIIYLVTAICFAVFALFELIAGVSANGQYGGNPLAVIRSLFVPLALAFVGIILSRAFLEGMAALVKKNDDKQE